jgi:hypothetical protein
MNESTRQYARKNETKRENLVSRKQRDEASQTLQSPIEQVLHLQKTIGNQAVTELIQSGAIQAKLKISPPNDIYEQEADRLADQVMRMSEPKQSLVNGHSSLVQRESTCPECEEKEDEEIQTKPLVKQLSPLVQRQTLDEDEEIMPKLKGYDRLHRQAVPEEEEETPAQLKAAPGGTPEVTPGIESNINSMKGGGQPLSESSRSFFEPRFGMDFSQVRVHTCRDAVQMSRELNAQAFTYGNNIYFNHGKYSPGTSSGKRLLAHELTHVLQQANGIGNKIQMTPLKYYRTHDPSRVSNNDIKVTNEYQAYMNSNLVWQTKYGVTSKEALIACRLILRELHKGERVNWYAQARKFVIRARKIATTEPPQCPSPPPGHRLRNPNIPSRGLCRGACGADCDTDACNAQQNLVLCLSDPLDIFHRTCTYAVLVCGSHRACRIHDACYDECAANGEMGLCGDWAPCLHEVDENTENPCHCRCDWDCCNTYGRITCARWAKGYGPQPDRLRFTDPPTDSGSILGPCS